jgi:hypothetical protein
VTIEDVPPTPRDEQRVAALALSLAASSLSQDARLELLRSGLRPSTELVAVRRHLLRSIDTRLEEVIVADQLLQEVLAVRCVTSTGAPVRPTVPASRGS